MVYRRLTAWRHWLWPGRCLLCRARTGADDDWCPGCRADLPWLKHACLACATPLPRSGQTCGRCQQKPPVFDRTLAALYYRAPLDRLVMDLKYRRRLDLARALGRLLADRVRAATAPLPDLVLPVPLHRTRLRERGYNQSQELARVVARELKLPLAARAARRTRATHAQTRLKRDERARNVRNAFAVARELAGLHVAIVDDVMTSGHTASALARALRRAGAAEISLWVVARA